MSQSSLPSAGLVELCTLDSSIVIDIPYASSDHFVARMTDRLEPIYPVNRAFVRPEVGQALINVQKALRASGWGLKIWDAYRPFHIQEEFWAVFPNSQYIAKPTRHSDGTPQSGSMHSRGAAVDVTLLDENGKEALMPTGFDDFSEKAWRNYRGGSQTALKNRDALELVMHSHGFQGLPTEWWHFNFLGGEQFPLLDLPLTKEISPQ